MKCIIDTKWKVPKDDKPADPDLKQMYAYNLPIRFRHKRTPLPG